MSFSRLSMAVLFLFFLGLAITSEADPNYLYHICPNNSTFTPNGTYQSNLNLLLSSLASNSTSNNGFHYTTTGQTPDTVYGLFLCRGDVSTDVCQDCVTFATQEVLLRCPVERESVFWYDECLLRYSNWDFFNIISEADIILFNTQNAKNQTSFDDLVVATMNGTASQASSGSKKFATGAHSISLFNVLYTLAQCTQDLSTSNCQRCLQVTIPQLRSNSLGGRTLARSCNVRYETYLFYNQSVVPATTPASLPPPAEVGVPGSPRVSSSRKMVIIVAGVVGTITIAICSYYSWRWMAKYRERRGKSKEMLFDRNDENMNRDQTNQYELQEVPLFLLRMLAAATNNFHVDNKLGQGGFGPVYRGKLLDGQEIAVKRLSRNSGQGLKEFMNEVVVISKLQHRNLVRLLGCCVEGEEKMLIYEYMPKNSLDTVLFNPSKQEFMDWRKRFNIIDGIGRGLVYLHRDSRLKIIHRDLKASNILLDEELNPKISDFGVARIFGKNEDQVNTQRIVGTYGYISPEYAMGGHISDKSDVFSFGVLLLEIISGRKNTSFYHDKQFLSLLGFAWKLWNEDNIAAFVDPSLSNSHNEMEIVRCIHVGMLCVQEFVIDRPTMSIVLSMLHSEILDLPAPRQPAFTGGRVIGDLESPHQNQKKCSLNTITVTTAAGR